MDEISRITALRYFPTDQDVLKARLKTMGVVEHSFIIYDAQRRGVNWKIYDVGGARNQRHAWAPYFEDVNAVIFLAPISAFDQVLAEDPTVNRLDDSMQLWKNLVSNKLLANVSIVLFLNKIDLLQAKLKSGVRLNQYMPQYGSRSNDYASVSEYFYNKFGAIHQEYTARADREFKIHLTSVTDTQRTAKIIQSVRDIIIKANLRSLHLM
ncbi:guanine nucleotide-binding protein alpha-4 subunit [Leucogyrophana mollusca]|uniref:Guanine nucleotide-binding protein alpha-4 subunit n=1 Tax=Leucogyrophana mollusca TaxID=85980 RepID=A0ACB8BAQ9_9AGAM|nr:guanine nucleotide-binding protein alpha-4 subunit [Leucogyrophana mollusca]